MKDKKHARWLRINPEIPKGWDKKKFLQVIFTPCKSPAGNGPLYEISKSAAVQVLGIARISMCTFPIADFFLDQVPVQGQEQVTAIGQILAHRKQVLSYVCDECFDDHPGVSEADIVINTPIPKGFNMEKLSRYLEENPFTVVADITAFC